MSIHLGTLNAIARICAVVGVLAALTACAGAPNDIALARQCENGLKTAYQELDFAKAKGFGGSVDWSKAAGLLSAASIQNEFGKYPNCVNKVKRARHYIEKSQI
jgi:hypothetical protein